MLHFIDVKCKALDFGSNENIFIEWNLKTSLNNHYNLSNTKEKLTIFFKNTAYKNFYLVKLTSS